MHRHMKGCMRERPLRVLSVRASVSMELGCATLPSRGCVFQPRKLAKSYSVGIFMEASLHGCA